MAILQTLGIDATMAYQFGVFLVVYLVLSNVLFKPYFAAYEERKERTLGTTDTAERFVAEAQELESQYATKAKEINRKFKRIYDESRSEALKEHDRLVNQARSEAKDLVEKARDEIGKEMALTREELKKQIPSVTQSITARLMGKESPT